MEILRQVSLPGLYAPEDGAQITHEIADDLESFFYVFTWICVLYDGPNNTVTTPDNNTSIIRGWAEAAMETGGLANALNAKNAFVHSSQSVPVIRNQFTPFFQIFIPLALDWRALVHEEDDRRIFKRDPNGNHARIEPLTHQKVIDLLRHHLDTLPR